MNEKNTYGQVNNVDLEILTKLYSLGTEITVQISNDKMQWTSVEDLFFLGFNPFIFTYN